MEDKTPIKTYTENDNKSAALMSMEVGEVIAFPLTMLTSVRSLCSSIGLANNRQYRSSANRDNRTIEVTRIA